MSIALVSLHYIVSTHPPPFQIISLFCWLVSHFFCSIFFYVLWICKLLCPSSKSQNEGCSSKLHNKCQPSSFTNDVCLIILDVISVFICVCIFSVHNSYNVLPIEIGPELKNSYVEIQISNGRSQIWLQVTQPSMETFRNPVVFWGEARSACPKYMAKFGDFFPSKKTKYSFFYFSIFGEILRPKKGWLLHIINTWYKVYLNIYFEKLNLNSSCSMQIHSIFSFKWNFIFFQNQLIFFINSFSLVVHSNPKFLVGCRKKY